MEFIYSDGGRSKYFKSDCVTRAICNATNKDYKEVYNSLTRLNYSSARNGVKKKIVKMYIKSLGWKWTPCMGIGTGCKIHLNANELPSGVLIVSVSKHLTCVKNAVIYDTYDCSRNESRCVYGYWTKDNNV